VGHILTFLALYYFSCMLGTLRSDVRVGVEIHALLKDISLIYKFHSRDKKKRTRDSNND